MIPEIVRQRFQALFARDHRLGAALRLIGKVEIFQFAPVERLVNSRLQLPGQLALFLNGAEYGSLPQNQLSEIEQFVLDGADLDFVQIAGCLFAITGDEGNGGTFIEKFNCGHQAFQGNLQLGCNVKQKIGRQRLEFGHEAKRIHFSAPPMVLSQKDPVAETAAGHLRTDGGLLRTIRPSGFADLAKVPRYQRLNLSGTHGSAIMRSRSLLPTRPTFIYAGAQLNGKAMRSTGS